MSKTSFKGLGETGEDKEENSVEEEASHGTEAVPALVGESEATGGPTVSQSNQPICHRGSWKKQEWPGTQESGTHFEGSKG
ncbi:hypothetical protein O181_098714 [Austropuccinia psidii MF-1]|uniref:Uncharacterized protein n=1 Tax=Austropuccinia psidii MF-1 TaxID=1389203 RepID=A0A9Q3JBS8_9BASI|nr:hypothetical protein [Austropuccinia psidii MF-1]